MGDVKIPLFPEKNERNLKKSSQKESVLGGHRSVKKFSENDFGRTNVILNSEKTTGNTKRGGLPRLWASLSICWGSNAQVKISTAAQ